MKSSLELFKPLACCRPLTGSRCIASVGDGRVVCWLRHHRLLCAVWAPCSGTVLRSFCIALVSTLITLHMPSQKRSLPRSGSFSKKLSQGSPFTSQTTNDVVDEAAVESATVDSTPFNELNDNVVAPTSANWLRSPLDSDMRLQYRSALKTALKIIPGIRSCYWRETFCKRGHPSVKILVLLGNGYQTAAAAEAAENLLYRELNGKFCSVVVVVTITDRSFVASRFDAPAAPPRKRETDTCD